jgi:hypothetical protein
LSKRQVADLEPIALVLGLDQPAWSTSALPAPMYSTSRPALTIDLRALLGQQRKEVRYFRKHPMQDPAGEGGCCIG